MAEGSDGSMVLGSVLAQGILPQQCTHFWVIDPPNGPTSYGMCKLCGRKQQFRNSIETTSWNRANAKAEDE